MKNIRNQFLACGLIAMAVVMSGCSSDKTTTTETTTDSSTVVSNSAPPSEPKTTSSDPVSSSDAPKAPAEAPAETPKADAGKKPDEAKEPPTTPDRPKFQKAPPATRDNNEPELMTQKPPKKATEVTKPPVQVPKSEPEVPAKLVPSSGNPAKFVGVYTMDDDKLESINAQLKAKKKPPIVFEIEIKADGTYEFRQGTSKKAKTITGTVQATDTKVMLSPYKVNGEPAVARGDKVAFNFLLSSDGKKLLTIANTSSGKTNLNFKRVK